MPQPIIGHLKNIGTDNSQGEVYLTDIVTQAVQENITVHKFINPVAGDVLGVNSRLELSQAHHELQLRRNRQLMDSGVTMISPETIQVSPESSIAKDVTLHPGIEVKGASSISSGCHIGAGALLNNVTLGRNCRIGAYSCLDDCELPDNTHTKPHSHTC